MSAAPDIVGAGLAGLIAAHAWPRAEVFEIAPRPTASHQALLRFRSEAVARLTGIDFRKVLVRKGIWSGGAFHSPNIALANAYEHKVLKGALMLGDRSIWNIEPVERWVAPPNFYDRLLEHVGDRVHWGVKTTHRSWEEPVISTSPLPSTLSDLGISVGEAHAFERSPIHVSRFRVPHVDIFQTVYFPDASIPVYRASITGDTMIVESVREVDASDGAVECALRNAFGLRTGEFLGATEQRYGKIVPLPDRVRKPLLFNLSHSHNIFSLGRFATWRNILLDDVVHDIAVIKRLLDGNSAYDARRAAT